MSAEAMSNAARTSSGRIIGSTAVRAVWRFGPTALAGYRAVDDVAAPTRETREEAVADAIAYWEARDAGAIW